MKSYLKFAIGCAWLVFFAALWQNRPTTRTLPSVGLLSISRKITEPTAGGTVMAGQPSFSAALVPVTFRFPVSAGL